MKLKKTWMGICVWVIYLVGIIFAIGVTGFVSGLFPYYDRYIVAGAAGGACILLALVVGLIGNFIGAKLNSTESIRNFRKPVWLEVLIPIAILICSFFFMNYASGLANGYTGQMALYDSAVVAADGQQVQLTGFADIIYVSLLRVMMSFLGNSYQTAYMMNLILRGLAVLFLYITLRVSLGMLPAIVGSLVACVIPSFGYSLLNIISQHFIFTALLFLMMIVVIYVKGLESRASGKVYFNLISILIGLAIGAMVYLEPGSAIVLVILIAALFLTGPDTSIGDIVRNEIVLLLAGVASFFGMLILEAGTANIVGTLFGWTNRFWGFSENAWLTMARGSVYNGYLSLTLLAAAFISVFIYFAKGRCEKIVPWLLVSALGCTLSVFFGRSILNTEVFLITAVVIAISCGVACFTYYPSEEAEEIIDDAVEDNEAVSEVGTAMVVTPEGSNNEAADDNEAVNESVEKSEAEEASVPENLTEIGESSEEIKVEPAEKEIVSARVEAVPATEEASVGTEETTAVTEDAPAITEESVQTTVTPADEVPEQTTGTSTEDVSQKEEEKPRFVPEGMVLPMGEEDEEDLEPHFNMNRPEMADIGILSVGGSKKNEETVDDEQASSSDETTPEGVIEEPPVLKDDFDINIAPGDDFDI